MSVVLSTSSRAEALAWPGRWTATTGTPATLRESDQLDRLGERLEQAFEGIREEWWQVGRKLARMPGGELSHAASCAPYASDFGLMMAWRRLVQELATAPDDVLIVCDDPWLFRELQSLPGVRAAAPPPALWYPMVTAVLRGIAARMWIAVRTAWASLRLRRGRLRERGDAYLLVYGHPRSAPASDAYFGDLMIRFAELRRLVHTDDFAVVARLAADGRTESLHAYGSVLYALLVLPFVRWRPGRSSQLPFRWLVRRAATREGSGGAAAMTAWQIHCQERWLVRRRPQTLAWPWENHPWERALARAARRAGVHTIGYQHTDAGPHQFNMSPHAAVDGLAALPDVVLLNGPAYRGQFVAWGLPAERLEIGGAFRLPTSAERRYDRAGPVFVALSAIPEISREMLDAIREARRPGRRFLVKPHPMYAISVDEDEDGVRRTDTPFADIGPVSALFYGTGTSGIEGMLSGVPTFRLLPSDRVGIETMPDGLRARTVTRMTFDAELAKSSEPAPVDVGRFFTPVDPATWRKHLVAS